MAALWFAGITYLFRSVSWTPLGSPPEPAIKILYFDYNYIAVETSNGSAYRCNLDGMHFPNERECLEWVEIDLPSNAARATPASECRPLIPPGKKVDCASSIGGYEVNYVILDDDTVWDHSYFVGDLDLAAYMEWYLTNIGTVIVFLVGLIISGIILIWPKVWALLRRKQRNVHKP